MLPLSLAEYAGASPDNASKEYLRLLDKYCLADIGLRYCPLDARGVG